MKKRAVTKHTANIFHTAKSNMRVRGDMGEHIARRYIQAAGFVIVANNFCVQGAEVDIIARAPDGCLVFFEVKLRAREPVDHAAVLPRAKLARMQKAAGYGTAHNKTLILHAENPAIGRKVHILLVEEKLGF